MEKVAVYCGASAGNSKVYQEATVELAHWLVEHQLDLVYGGGGVGLMGLLAKSVVASGGTVHGIMPQELFDRGAALEWLSDLKIVANMDVRKQEMMSQSDGCIALPGGPGTIEEMAQAFSWARIGDNPNPCVFYNVAGYYDSLAKMFDEMTEKGFLTVKDRQKLLFSDSLTEIFEFMDTYEPPVVRSYHQDN